MSTPAEGLAGRGGGGLDGAGVDEIDGRRVHAIVRHQFACGAGQEPGVAIPQRYARAGGEQALGDGAAHALCPAGDDGPPAAQVDLVHGAVWYPARGSAA